MRRSREEKRVDKKREDERENERENEEKRKEGKYVFFFQKNVSRPSTPPDELAQNVSKKSPSDEFFLHFSSKVQNPTVFSIIYMIRIRFVGPVELIQNGFRAARYAPSLASTIPTQQMVPVYFPNPVGSQASQKSETWFINMIVPAQKTLTVASLDGGEYALLDSVSPRLRPQLYRMCRICLTHHVWPRV